MTRRLRVMILGLFCLDSVLLRPAWALWIDAQGTYLDDVTGQQNTWEGRFEAAGNRLSGTVDLSGIEQVKAAHVEGVIDFKQQRLDFSFSKPSSAVGVFSGHFEGSDLRGEFILDGGNRKGTWHGRWGAAPGLPVPEVLEEDSVGQMAEPFDPGAPLFDPAAVRPSDPYPFCALVRDERAAAGLSLGGASSLRAYCNREMELSGAHIGGLRRLIARMFPSWPALRVGPFSFLLPVVAQGVWDNVQVNDPSGPPSPDTFPYITQNEVSIAVSGATEGRAIAAFNDSNGLYGSLGYASSVDGGFTWTDQGSPPVGVLSGNGSDAGVVSDANGSFYISKIQFGPGRNYIGVSKSIGADLYTFSTFGYPVDASPTTSSSYFQDKPSIAIDKSNGNVYVCWTENGNNRRIRFSRSIDGGATYQQPTQMSPKFLTDPVTLNPGVIGCSIAVVPSPNPVDHDQGTVFVAWRARVNPGYINVVRSTDGGKSFPGTPCCQPGSGVNCGGYPACPILTSQARAPYAESVACGRFALSGYVASEPFPYLVADLMTSGPTVGTVYAVWDHFTGTDSEILFRRCTNCTTGQMNWSSNPILTLNDVTTNDQFQPRIAATVSGTAPQTSMIRVIWYDRRRDVANQPPGNVGNRRYDVYYTTSVDGGVGWQYNSRLTDVDEPNPLPALNPQFDCRWWKCYFGDYIGMSNYPTHNGFFISAWGDTRGVPKSGTPCPTPGLPSSSPDPEVYAAVGC